MSSVNAWVLRLQLEPHPEGGYFRQTYKSSEHIPQSALPDRYSGPRALSSAILYLLPGNQFSAFHQLFSDEIWHFHTGSCMELYLLSQEYGLQIRRLGPNPAQGEEYQVAVPAGTWMAARMVDANSFGLVGCTVAPGFEYEDFLLARREELIRSFPEQAELIQALTRS